jgi:type I restriction enzyme R subunit
MDVCIKDLAVGTLPAKTIIFAVSHRHALEIYQSFNRLYPDLQRRGLARIIDSHMERVEKTLDDFKTRDFPRVAISVDMLDTGIDVPAIRNLVFAKPVFSYVKFWQMIGRGTRLWTDPVSGRSKEDFLIIDHWDNFAYFQVNPEGKEGGSETEPLPTRLFRLRLEKLQILAGRAAEDAHAAARMQLQAMLADVPDDNINVAPHADELRSLRTDTEAWTPLHDEKVAHLSTTIAPLLRFSTITQWATLQFENLTEQLALACLKSDAGEIQRLRPRIVESIRLLPTDLPEVQAVESQRAFVLMSASWTCRPPLPRSCASAPVARAARWFG